MSEARNPSSKAHWMDIDGPLSMLRTRLEFLTEHFSYVDAEMSQEALHLFLCDALLDTMRAQEALHASWKQHDAEKALRRA